MMTSSNGNIFRVTGHLCGEFTGPRWIPRTKANRGTLMFSLICVWINGWVNNRDAGDLRRYRGHYDVTEMWYQTVANYLMVDKRSPILIWDGRSVYSYHGQTARKWRVPASRMDYFYYFLVISKMYKILWRCQRSVSFINCAHGNFIFLLKRFIVLINVTCFKVCGWKSVTRSCRSGHCYCWRNYNISHKPGHSLNQGQPRTYDIYVATISSGISNIGWRNDMETLFASSGESIGHQLVPFTTIRNTKRWRTLCCYSEKAIERTVYRPVIWDATRLM